MSQLHVIALQIQEFEKRKSPLHLRQDLCTFSDDNGKEYCSMTATFDGKLTFEFDDKVYEINWQELFRAVEEVHDPKNVVGNISSEGGVGVTELSPRGDN